MSIRTQIEILLDEYASGERPQKEVTDDIVTLVDEAYQKGWGLGYDEGYRDGENG